jgi:hypothetical protein
MASQLNYELLEKLVDAHANHCLEVVKLGITRFGDDKSEILLGETVPFVANVKFVVTEASRARLRDQQRDLASGDTLFWINNRGEIKTDRDVEIDSDSVARWVGDHYDFTFRVRGVDRSAFRPYRREPVDVDQYATVEPWLQEIQTVAVRGEVIDIDFDVKAKAPGPRPVRKVLLSTREIPLLFEQARLGVRIEVQGNYEAVGKLARGRYRIALRSDDDPDLQLTLVVDTVQPADAPRSAFPEPAERSRKDPTTAA